MHLHFCTLTLEVHSNQSVGFHLGGFQSERPSSHIVWNLLLIQSSIIYSHHMLLNK